MEPDGYSRKIADGGVLEEYRQDGGLHREDGPAIIRHRSDGTIQQQEYYRDGRRHREDGPAWIQLDSAGTVILEE
jgi:uncharacterized protein